MRHSSEQSNSRARKSEETPQHVPREVILRISRTDDVAPRGGARGHADEGIGGTSRRRGGDGEVDPPQFVGAGNRNFSTIDSSSSGGGHDYLDVAVGSGRRRGKEGFGENFGRRGGEWLEQRCNDGVPSPDAELGPFLDFHFCILALAIQPI